MDNYEEKKHRSPSAAKKHTLEQRAHFQDIMPIQVHREPYFRKGGWGIPPAPYAAAIRSRSKGKTWSATRWHSSTWGKPERMNSSMPSSQ